MIRINKNVASVVVLSILIGTTTLLAVQRYSIDILQSTVTSCQALVETFSVRLPHSLLILPIIFAIFLLFSVIVRFLFYFTKIMFLQKKEIELIEGGKKFIRILNELDLSKTTKLIDDNNPFAFCFGVFNPKIYISTATLKLGNVDELKAIFHHEKFHLQKKDTGIMFFISTIESLFPFFPIFSDILKQYQIEQEIKADKATILRMGSSQPIISILKKLLVRPDFRFSYASQIASRDTLEPRINELIKGNSKFRKFKTINIVVSFMSLIFLSAAIYSPVQAIDLHENQQDSIVVCLSGQNCTKVCRGQEQPYSKPLFYPIQNASYPPQNAER